MSFRNFSVKEISITSRLNYETALFGLLQVGFVSHEGRVYFPFESKQSLESSLHFYEKFISKEEKYPVYDGKKFVWMDTSSGEVLNSVLGLPKYVFKCIDSSKNIISQLNFEKGLDDLKREAYVSLASKSKGKWFIDDFKLYCMKKGFFFMYDETKPFLENKENILPIYVDEDILSDKYLSLINEASERFIIDLGGKVSLLPLIKRLDEYSFLRRIQFFINKKEDKEISALIENEEIKEEYTFLLKKYIVALINTLFDDYSFEVLGKASKKVSFLSIDRICADRKPVYNVSSYFADMYSYDGKNFFFPLNEKERISSLIEYRINENKYEDILSLYSSLGLPYLGFSFVKNLTLLTKEEIISKLPFADVSNAEIYLSKKRVNEFYCYQGREEKQQIVIKKRLLLSYGVLYESKFIYIDNEEKELIKITKLPSLKDERLKKLLSQSQSFTKMIVPSYIFFKDDGGLLNKIKLLDEKSNNNALFEFYSLFDFRCFDEVVDQLLSKYGLSDIKSDELIEFFKFTLDYLLSFVSIKNRLLLMKEKDILALKIIDKPSHDVESFEPALPLPYVSTSNQAYSFRKGYKSKAYICECQYQAIKNKADYYLKYFYKYEYSKDNDDAMQFLLDKLNLPEDVSCKIPSYAFYDIASYVPYKKCSCHICNNKIPLYHGKIDDNKEAKYNIYLTYIKSKAAENGVYIENDLKYNVDVETFFKMLKNNTYHTLLHFDKEKINKILYPYVNLTTKQALSLVCSFLTKDLTNPEIISSLERFYELGDDLIYKLMFDCQSDDYHYIYENIFIFGNLYYVYRMIEMAYALYCSSDIVEDENHTIALNFDFNKKLKHPYVALGENINAYLDDPNDISSYVLCQCDKDGMYSFAKRYAFTFEHKNLNPNIEIPLIFGLMGMPYLVSYYHSSFDIENHTIDDLFSELHFEKDICRRHDIGKNHSAYSEPFVRAFPYKEDHSGEYCFARNGMLHDGIKILTDGYLEDIKYEENMKFSLMDDLGYFSTFDFSTDELPESVFTHFVLSTYSLEDKLDDFTKKNPHSQEITAIANKVISDSHKKDDKCILGFFMETNGGLSLKDALIKYFPTVENINEDKKNDVMQKMLGFLIYLLECMITSYVDKERVVGK